MSLKGKGFFLWQIKRIAGGDPVAIAKAAQAAGLSHVLIKVADGKFGYNFTNGVDMVEPLVPELRARNIRVWGWQYVYGVNAQVEAEKAIARVKQFNLDGFVVNAERQFIGGSMHKVAKKYMRVLRDGLGGKKIALSTYRYPSVIPGFPYQTFLEYCDIAMPQVYWVRASNPAAQLRRSVAEYGLLKPSRPVIPTGAAFFEDNWKPTPEQVTEFLNAARQLGLSAANFWEWHEAQRTSNGQLWDAVSAFDWPGYSSPVAVQPEDNPPVSTPSTDIATRYLKALNSGKPDRVVQLYEEKTGQLVKGKKTLKGRTKIYGWYNRLLTRKLPEGKFTLIALSREGNVVRLKWTAKSKKARIKKSIDTIRMSKDHPQLISLHTVEFRAR
jgi:hypothetical protein